MSDSPQSLVLLSPAGVIADPRAVRRAAKRLATHGFEVEIDAAALARHQRFAGNDATRLAALHRVAATAPSVARIFLTPSAGPSVGILSVNVATKLDAKLARCARATFWMVAPG